MNKSLLRSIYKKRRQALSSELLQGLSLQLLEQSLKLAIWDKRLYHIFLSIPDKNEINTDPFIQKLYSLEKKVAVPKIKGKGLLEHYLLTSETEIKTNTWGVPEPISGKLIDPKEIDVVFVPLLIFDLSGFRVGYGGGYYDTFLGDCNPNVITVGLSLFDPVEAIEDLYHGDIPLNYVICPETVYEFNPRF